MALLVFLRPFTMVFRVVVDILSKFRAICRMTEDPEKAQRE
jgi:hypothetical protein